jgi:ribosomal protein L15
VTITVSGASAKAREAVEAKGGTVTMTGLERAPAAEG